MQLQTGKVDTKDLIAMSDNDNVSPEGKMMSRYSLAGLHFMRIERGRLFTIIHLVG